MDPYVVSASVLAGLSGRTVRSVHQRAKKEGWLFEKTKGRGGTRKEFFVDSLPGDYQKLIIYSIKTGPDRRDKMDRFEVGENNSPITSEVRCVDRNVTANAPPPSTVYRILNLPADPDRPDPWHSLPEQQKESGFRLLNIVNQARDISDRAKRDKTKRLKEFAKRENIGYATLRRHMKTASDALSEARKNGEDTIFAQVTALTYKYGNNKGVCRAFDERAVKYAFARYCTQKHLNLSDVYDDVTAVAACEGWQVGSYETLARIIKKMDGATLTRSRKGNHHFEDKRLVKILRNYDEIPPNFMWCGDHHIFDVFTKVQDGNGAWIFMRPWITAWLDMCSRSLMGWCISFNPNSRCIAMALSHGISEKQDPNFPQHGLPDSVYIDNGKDYRSKYLRGEKIIISGDGTIDYPEMIEKFSALGIDPYYIDLEYDPDENAWAKNRGDKQITVKNIRVNGVYSRLNISQRYATAYHPWAKPIERFFRTVVQSFSRSLPGWCGSNPDERPEKLKWELKSGQVLTLSEFCDAWYGWVVDKYHKRPHSGHGMNGMTPDQAFLSRLPRPQAVEPNLLDFALMKKERVKMHNWGFNLNSHKFEPILPTNLYGGLLANQVIGEWVQVLFDYDYKTVRVYKDGAYVCDARPVRRASFIHGNSDVQVEKLKLQSFQKQAARAVMSAINTDLPKSRTRMPEDRVLLALSNEADSDISDSSPSDEDIIPITRDERYRQILRKLAASRPISEKDDIFKADFEASAEYAASAELYETEFEYLKYKSKQGGADG